MVELDLTHMCDMSYISWYICRMTIFTLSYFHYIWGMTIISYISLQSLSYVYNFPYIAAVSSALIQICYDAHSDLLLMFQPWHSLYHNCTVLYGLFPISALALILYSTLLRYFTALYMILYTNVMYYIKYLSVLSSKEYYG